MKYASAHYVAEPNPEIYIFVDEKPVDLPEGAAEICNVKELEEFLTLIEPYFQLAKNK